MTASTPENYTTLTDVTEIPWSLANSAISQASIPPLLWALAMRALIRSLGVSWRSLGDLWSEIFAEVGRI